MLNIQTNNVSRSEAPWVGGVGEGWWRQANGAASLGTGEQPLPESTGLPHEFNRNMPIRLTVFSNFYVFQTIVVLSAWKITSNFAQSVLLFNRIWPYKSWPFISNAFNYSHISHQSKNQALKTAKKKLIPIMGDTLLRLFMKFINKVFPKLNPSFAKI